MAQNQFECLHGFTFRDCAIQLREAAGGGDSEPDDDERQEALELVQMAIGKSWKMYEGPNGEKARSRADVESMAAGGKSTRQVWNAAHPKKRQRKE